MLKKSGFIRQNFYGHKYSSVMGENFYYYSAPSLSGRIIERKFHTISNITIFSCKKKKNYIFQSLYLVKSAKYFFLKGYK